MGRSSGNPLSWSLPAQTAGTGELWVASTLYPASVDAKTINGKPLKFQIPGCLFLTGSRALLCTQLFHPEQTLPAFGAPDLTSSHRVSLAGKLLHLLCSSLLGGFPPPSTLHRFSQSVPATFKFLPFGIQDISDSHFKLLCFSPIFFTCFSLVEK